MRFLLVRRRRFGVPVDLDQDDVVGVVVVLDHVEPQDAGLAQGGSGVDERRSQEVRGAPRQDPDMNVNDQHGQILHHAGALYTSNSGLPYQIKQLEKAGLVRRTSSPADVRGVVAVLTDAGRERLVQAAPGHVAAVRALLIDVLTEQQLAAVADGLGEVARRLGEG